MADTPEPAFAPPRAPSPAPALNPYAAPRAAIAQDIESGGAAALAERSTRLRAAIIDYLIFVVPMAAMLIPIAMSRGRTVGTGIIFGALVFAAIVVANGLLLARNGQTIGKKSSGIRVVRSDGSDAGFVRLFFLRGGLSWLIAAIPAIGSLYALVDVLCIFRSDRRCLHDLIADTMVVEAE